MRDGCGGLEFGGGVRYSSIDYRAGNGAVRMCGDPGRSLLVIIVNRGCTQDAEMEWAGSIRYQQIQES